MAFPGLLTQGTLLPSSGMSVQGCGRPTMAQAHPLLHKHPGEPKLPSGG